DATSLAGVASPAHRGSYCPARELFRLEGEQVVRNRRKWVDGGHRALPGPRVFSAIYRVPRGLVDFPGPGEGLGPGEPGEGPGRGERRRPFSATHGLRLDSVIRHRGLRSGEHEA